MLFDQRISHSGNDRFGSRGPSAAEDRVGRKLPGRTRVLVTAGFGRNNMHSDDYEAGAKMLQDNFNDPECGFQGYGFCGMARVRAAVLARRRPK